jgi:hypothetical protein
LSKNLYVHKPRGNGIKLEAKQETSMLSTLEENKTFYTNRQVERAKRARALARALGCPLKMILRLNLIKDCLVVQEDVKLAEMIFSKDVAII